jgi:AraC-like DNA-binding protein
VINTRLNKNFYDYINAQRVEAFIRLVAEPQYRRYTLLALAFQCGFNSKSSFNRNFKKVMGDSPSEYLERIHITLEQEG